MIWYDKRNANKSARKSSGSCISNCCSSADDVACRWGIDGLARRTQSCRINGGRVRLSRGTADVVAEAASVASCSKKLRLGIFAASARGHAPYTIRNGRFQLTTCGDLNAFWCCRARRQPKYRAPPPPHRHFDTTIRLASGVFRNQEGVGWG